MVDPLQQLDETLVSLGGHDISSLDILRFVAFFIGLAFLARIIRRRVVNRLLKHTKTDEGVRYATSRIAGYAVWVLGLLIGLPLLGFELQSILVAVGALGIGIGLGLQNIAENVVSGLILLFGRPVKVGDRIEVSGYTGAVVAIHPRVTELRTNDNEIIMLPNALLVSTPVKNFTHNDRKVRYSFSVGVSYDADPNTVRDCLLEVARENGSILDEPVPDVVFLGFGESSLDFKLRVYTSRMLTVPEKLTSELSFAIWYRLKEEGIEIPFPQRDVHIKSGGSPTDGAPPRP